MSWARQCCGRLNTSCSAPLSSLQALLRALASPRADAEACASACLAVENMAALADNRAQIYAKQACRASVLCCAVLCCAVLCCAVLCCAVLCCAVLRTHTAQVPAAIVAAMKKHGGAESVQDYGCGALAMLARGSSPQALQGELNVLSSLDVPAVVHASMAAFPSSYSVHAGVCLPRVPPTPA